MGHAIGTELQSDPYGVDYTTTSFDGMGNVYQQSNPYRSTSETTYGLTTFRYDALGRKIQQKDADKVSTVRSRLRPNQTAMLKLAHRAVHG